jgi:Ca2+-binding RTX toxin-like protein
LTTVRLDSTAVARTITHEAGTKAVDLRAAVGGDLTVNDTGTATNDVLTITNNAAATDIFATNNLAVGGFETVTFDGSGSGNAASQDFGTITLTTDTGGTDTINFIGSNAVTTTGSITADVIDASGLTGLGLTMGAAATDATTITGSAAIDTLVADSNSGTAVSGGAGNDIITGGTGNDTLSGGDGNDTINVSTGSDIVSGGAGDDIISMAAGSLSSGDAVDGGDGTDTLNISNIAAIGAAAGQRLSNFERLDLDHAALGGDVTIDLAALINNSAFDRITIGDTNDAVVTVSNVLDAFSDLRIDGTDTGNNDSEAILTRLVDTSSNALTLTITGGETFKTLTMANEETVTITSSNSSAATITTLNAADLTTLNLTGSGDVIITNAIGSSASLATVDASGLGGAATVNGSNSSTAITMTAGTGVATFTGGVASDTITGGGAADILGGGAGADIISGGASGDTITGGTGNDTLTGGGGADNFVITGTQGSTNIKTITDFAVSASGTNDVIQWSLGSAGAIEDTAGGTEGAGATTLVEYDGTALASNTTGVSYIKATALTYNSSADLLTAIDNANITVDGGETAFANNANILATYYDVDGGFASFGTLSSAISATAGVFDSQVTYTESARMTMSSSTYANLDADNIEFIA